jgi:hypothetical protein
LLALRHVHRIRHRSADPERDAVSGSATVERAVEVAPGMTQVEITGLLANFNTDTIRLQADAGIQVGQVLTRDRSNADSPSPREADLGGEDPGPAGPDRRHRRRLQIGPDGPGLPRTPGRRRYRAAPGASRSEGRCWAPSTPSARAAPMRSSACAAEIKKRALAKQLDALKRELGKAAGEHARQPHDHGPLGQAGRQAAPVLPGHRAGWKPAYRASLDSNASTVELERLATISQKTGEDWSRVKLKLSTGQPTLSVAAPDPSSWLLNYRPPMERNPFQENAPTLPRRRPAPAVFNRTVRPAPTIMWRRYWKPRATSPPNSRCQHGSTCRRTAARSLVGLAKHVLAGQAACADLAAHQRDWRC